MELGNVKSTVMCRKCVPSLGSRLMERCRCLLLQRAAVSVVSNRPAGPSGSDLSTLMSFRGRVADLCTSRTTSGKGKRPRRSEPQAFQIILRHGALLRWFRCKRWRGRLVASARMPGSRIAKRDPALRDDTAKSLTLETRSLLEKSARFPSAPLCKPERRTHAATAAYEPGPRSWCIYR